MCVCVCVCVCVCARTYVKDGRERRGECDKWEDGMRCVMSCEVQKKLIITN